MEEENICTICHCQLTRDQPVTSTLCHHKFHEDCVLPLLVSENSWGLCPAPGCGSNVDYLYDWHFEGGHSSSPVDWSFLDSLQSCQNSAVNEETQTIAETEFSSMERRGISIYPDRQPKLDGHQQSQHFNFGGFSNQPLNLSSSDDEMVSSSSSSSGYMEDERRRAEYVCPGCLKIFQEKESRDHHLTLAHHHRHHHPLSPPDIH